MQNLCEVLAKMFCKKRLLNFSRYLKKNKKRKEKKSLRVSPSALLNGDASDNEEIIETIIL